ncbi:family 2 glycosyl transferase [Flammeovirgaceae bacterium 311]|nr:family 2 glycosyl transferase [Flammeovirgaceae bacterium 311]
MILMYQNGASKVSKQLLVSIIMPAYNASNYIEKAINSVIYQSYTHWELIIINDGSTDTTRQCVLNYTDTRIRYHEQANRGVSAARNLGLSYATGNFICFLDADDEYPFDSILDRVSLFLEHPYLSFADGMVEVRDRNLDKVLYHKYHSWEGQVFDQLIQLNPDCFFGPSWMLKADIVNDISFKEGMTHGEDLLFYIEAARKGGYYKATNSCVLYYRKSSSSAMSNLDGLAKGYRILYASVKSMPESGFIPVFNLKMKIKKIMALSYLSKSQYLKACNALISLP